MAPKGNILVVEDDENLRMALEDNLLDEGYVVVSVARGKAALQEIARGKHQLVILDIMLPDMDGYEICRRIREQDQPMRVLMLTARSLESDLVAGFDAGADDYLSKPYRIRELLARVGALLRRGSTSDEEGAGGAFTFGHYSLEVEARSLTRSDGGEIELTRTEFDLLVCLLRNHGRAMARDDILTQAWDPGVVVDPRTVDNFVSSLKRKLGWTKAASYRIKTVRGVGYRMEID